MDPTIDPTFLLHYLSFVLDAPIICQLINEFVGDSDHYESNNGSRSNGPESDKSSRDDNISSILSSPNYSYGENFDPSEHFAPDESEADDGQSEGNAPEDASVYDSDGEPIPHHPPITRTLRRSTRVAAARGPIIFHQLIERQNGELISYPVFGPIDVVNPDDYPESDSEWR